MASRSINDKTGRKQDTTYGFQRLKKEGYAMTRGTISPRVDLQSWDIHRDD
jgi:hypothetical protein